MLGQYIDQETVRQWGMVWGRYESYLQLQGPLPLYMWCISSTIWHKLSPLLVLFRPLCLAISISTGCAVPSHPLKAQFC